MVEECCICLENLTGEICQYECGHKFHMSCVKRWINKNDKLIMPCCLCKNENIKNIFNVDINESEIYGNRSTSSLITNPKNKKNNKINWKKILCCF